MNDFVSRIEAVSAERAMAARVPGAVAPVQASAPVAQTATQGDMNSSGRQEQSRQEAMASAADYAKVRTEIAEILADLSASKDSAMAARVEAEGRLADLLPPPVVLLPMPPASRDRLEMAVQIANAMVRQAELTRAAQAHIAPGQAEALFA